LQEQHGYSWQLLPTATLYSIHSQRRHQKRIAGALVAKIFMGIIRSHSLKGNKNTRPAKVPVSIFAL